MKSKIKLNVMMIDQMMACGMRRKDVLFGPWALTGCHLDAKTSASSRV